MDAPAVKPERDTRIGMPMRTAVITISEVSRAVVKDLVGGIAPVPIHPAGDLVDSVVAADVLGVANHPVSPLVGKYYIVYHQTNPVPRGDDRTTLIQPQGEVMPNTIRLHRVVAAKPEKLYRAFLEPDAIASWLPPFGFTCTVHELDAKVGGNHRMSFRNFTTGKSHAFGGSYLELVPGERLVYTDKFDDPHLPGEMKVTVSLKAVSVGTEVNIEQQGVPDVIPAEACYLGWQESLRKLARLVEPEINQ
jgi:uncharacterized protein YndB with AHSA1/START domain